MKPLGKLIIKMYSMGACAVLGMSHQDVLSEDLESDPFLNSFWSFSGITWGGQSLRKGQTPGLCLACPSPGDSRE